MGRKRTFDAGSATAGSISTAKTMKATFSAHFISLWSLVLRIPRPRVEPVPHPERTHANTLTTSFNRAVWWRIQTDEDWSAKRSAIRCCPLAAARAPVLQVPALA